MLDNLELIKPLLNFEKEGDFYALFILKRKKDQPEGEKDNHQSVRTIKTYYIDSLEYLDKRYEEIKTLCELFKARAYIHVCRQNHKDIGLSLLAELANKIKDGVTKFNNIFDSVVGQIKITGEKRWIIDIDTKDKHYFTKIVMAIEFARPEGNKIITAIPTKNGWHLITKPFDVKQYKENLYEEALYGEPEPDIQKRNPTLLYLPEILKQ